MKKIFTTLLGLTLVFGAVSCGGDKNDDLDKAKIEAEQKAKAEAEKKAKEEAEKKAKAEAKQKAIKSLNEATDLASLNNLFAALSEELKSDAEVLKAKNDKKAELEKKAEEEKLKAMKWLEGKNFVFQLDMGGPVEFRTISFKEKFAFTRKSEMLHGEDLVLMQEPTNGTYKYLKPTLTITYQVQIDIYGGGMKDVSEEYQVDEEKGTISGFVNNEKIVYKLKK